MGKKSKRRFDGIVYSTDPDFHDNEESFDAQETLPPRQQTLKIHVDRLKGNKKATRIENFIGTETDLKDLGKELKQLCGCGGTVKEGKIILQGDFREKVINALEGKGYKYKRVGG
ncbi:MAG: translation initiation factor [Bacteroidota bacterium]